jgi:type IV pilus assembly protein PilM
MFFSKGKSILGIDIGTTNVKVVQVTTTAENAHILDTYGMVNAPFENSGTGPDAAAKVAEILKTLLKKAGVTTKKVVASLPNSEVFTSVIDMPPMTEGELANAVEFEAKKYVPLPMSDVTLSWAKVESSGDGKSKVLITAVPNSVLNSYKTIFQLADLEPIALEIEALALIRSIIADDLENILLIDVGSRATHLNIIEKGNLVLTKNVSVGGQTITEKISDSLKISTSRAEQFKKDFGLNQATLIPESIKPILNKIKEEAKQLQSIYRAQSKAFDKILLVGGSAPLPGLEEFFGDLGVKVIKGDPLIRLTYNPDLKPILSQYAGNLAVSIGLALRVNK